MEEEEESRQDHFTMKEEDIDEYVTLPDGTKVKLKDLAKTKPEPDNG